MAGGGKRADGKRLKKAGDVASHGGEPPRAKVGTSKATEKGRKRRQGQETSGPSEAAGADQEQRPARERPGPSEAEGGQRELRCREGPGPSEAAEAVEATEAMEERRPARDTPGPSAAMGPEQERPSEAAEWYTPASGARGGADLSNMDLEQCNIGGLVSEPAAVDRTPPIGLRLGPGFEPVPEWQPSPEAELLGGNHGSEQLARDVLEGSVTTRNVRRRLGTADLGSSLVGDSAAGTARGARGGNKGGAEGGRPPSSKRAEGPPRWCKPLYVHDPDKPDSLLRVSARTGVQGDKDKIICRICGKGVSFSSCSYTTAARHVLVHGVTRDNLDVAVAFANKADDDGKPFPSKEWQEQLASSKGARKVLSYMRQAPYETGSQLWRECQAAIAKWLAADALPMAVVETKAFRAMCRTLNGRCPAYSRKTITNKVSC